MIDSDSAASPDWLPPLRNVIRRSGHETRNALNGLVVNLEVVRSRLARSGGQEGVLSFADQAVAQAEESVRLNESTAALLSLLVGSIDAAGRLRCARTDAEPPGIRFDVDGGTAERVVPRLAALGEAMGFGAETRDGAVILSFSRESSAELNRPE